LSPNSGKQLPNHVQKQESKEPSLNPKLKQDTAALTGVLLDRERLARQTRLVNVHGAAFAQQTIGRNDVTNLQQHEISGDELTSANLLPRAVTLHVADFKRVSSTDAREAKSPFQKDSHATKIDKSYRKPNKKQQSKLGGAAGGHGKAPHHPVMWNHMQEQTHVRATKGGVHSSSEEEGTGKQRSAGYSWGREKNTCQVGAKAFLRAATASPAFIVS
jgi:hypothetical protein